MNIVKIKNKIKTYIGALTVLVLPPRHRNCRSLTFDVKCGIYSPALVPEARDRT